GTVLGQLAEERAVRHNRLPEVLGGGVALDRLQIDRVRRPVIGHDIGMAGRDQVGVRLKVANRVSARAHDVLYELVRVGDRDLRAVDESALELRPFFLVTLSVDATEGAQVELVMTRGAFAKVAFGLAATFAGRDRSVVLRAEALAKLGVAASR